MFDLAKLTRFAPLLALTNRPAGSMTDDELTGMATAIAGPDFGPWFNVLTRLRSAAPEAVGLEILSSPAAQEMLNKLVEDNEQESGLLCTCPHCGRSFSTNL